MKKLLIFILFFLCYNLYCQDKEPTPYDIIWGASTTARPIDLDSFQLDKIKLGFQWSGSIQMSNALKHNVVHGHVPLSGLGENIDFDTEMLVIGQPQIEGIRNMAMIQYEPTLITEDYRNFVTRKNDSTNAIFGFGNVHGTILDSSESSNINYNRLLLYKDSLSTYPADSIVLSEITPSDEFFTLDGNYQLGGYDGERWNLTINLRRLDLIDDALTNDTVLVIKLPYVAIDSTGDTVTFPPKEQ
ncbi:MAG: hypothetical protein H6615_08200 [Ignavibacteria bacterium]|nr:hypothetical protein [Ignavibacteria bacterium]